MVSNAQFEAKNDAVHGLADTISITVTSQSFAINGTPRRIGMPYDETTV